MNELRESKGEERKIQGKENSRNQYLYYPKNYRNFESYVVR